MSIFSRYNPKDRIYLSPIETEGTAWGDTNIVFCDAKGVLSTGQVDQSVMDTVEETLTSYRAQDRFCAVVCLEVDKQRSVTFGVEIDYEEALALDAILTAVRDGKIVNGMAPETLRKHPRQIIDKAKDRLREVGLNKL